MGCHAVPNKAEKTGSDHKTRFFIDNSTKTGSDNFYKTKCSHVFKILRVAVGVGHEGGRVYDTFVEDESVAFGARCYFQLFGGLISVEEVGVDDGDVTAFLERLCDFVEEVLSHDVIIELSGASDVEREPSEETLLAFFEVPDFVDLLDDVTHLDGFTEFGRAPGPAQHTLVVRMVAIVRLVVKRFGHLFFNASAAEWKREFAVVTKG